MSPNLMALAELVVVVAIVGILAAFGLRGSRPSPPPDTAAKRPEDDATPPGEKP